MGESIGAALFMIAGLALAFWLNRFAWSYGTIVGVSALVGSAVMFVVLMICGAVLGNWVEYKLRRH